MQKKSISIAGHRTSIALEPEFWAAAVEIAHLRQLTLTELIVEIDQARTGHSANLASAIRCFILAQYRELATSK